MYKNSLASPFQENSQFSLRLRFETSRYTRLELSTLILAWLGISIHLVITTQASAFTELGVIQAKFIYQLSTFDKEDPVQFHNSLDE